MRTIKSFHNFFGFLLTIFMARFDGNYKKKKKAHYQLDHFDQTKEVTGFYLMIYTEYTENVYTSIRTIVIWNP